MGGMAVNRHLLCQEWVTPHGRLLCMCEKLQQATPQWCNAGEDACSKHALKCVKYTYMILSECHWFPNGTCFDVSPGAHSPESWDILSTSVHIVHLFVYLGLCPYTCTSTCANSDDPCHFLIFIFIVIIMIITIIINNNSSNIIKNITQPLSSFLINHQSFQ